MRKLKDSPFRNSVALLIRMEPQKIVRSVVQYLWLETNKQKYSQSLMSMPNFTKPKHAWKTDKPESNYSALNKAKQYILILPLYSSN